MTMPLVGDYFLHHDKVLGVGGFGKVVLGSHQVTGKKVAVKIIVRSFIAQHKLLPYVKAEAKIMGSIRHPHVVRLLTVVEGKDAMYFVTELAPHGELFDRIVQSKYFQEDQARQYYQQIISAVYACHSRNICHRDLKAENLLLDAEDRLKVCDFGLSHVIDIEQEHEIMLHSIAGSLDYQCPEILREERKGYDGRRADLWAAAVILGFMVNGYLPFTATTDEETKSNILNGKFRLASHVSEGVRMFLMRQFNLDPLRRPTMDDILADDWFLVDLNTDLFPENTVGSPMPGSPISSPVSLADSFHHTPANLSVAGDMLLSIHKAFDTLDVSGSGVLHRDEIRDVLIQLNDGKPVQDSEVDTLMSALDVTHCGQVTRNDFAVAFAAHLLPKTSDLQKKFQLERLVNVFHFHVEAELLAELRQTFDGLDKRKKGILYPEDHPEMVPLGVFGEDGKKCCTFDNFGVFWKRTGRGLKLCNKLKVLHGLVKYEFTANMHQHGGFTVKGTREEIQKLILERMGKLEQFELSNPHPGVVHVVKRADRGRISSEVSIQLTPAQIGYTKVDAIRLRGPTLTSHEVQRELFSALENEKNQVDDDTQPVGEAEEI